MKKERRIGDAYDGELVDLHTHSTYSDGSLTPKELAELAASARVKALALTDHDTTDGLPEAMAAAGRLGVTLIPGVELSSSIAPAKRAEIHVLGYFNGNAFERIEGFLESVRQERVERNKAVIDKLASAGARVDGDAIARSVGRRAYGRPHIAAALVEAGVARSVEDAFRRFLAPGGAAYVPRRASSPAERVAAIASAGGFPVLAHPVHIGFKLSELRKLAAELAEVGLRGIEAYYPDNTPQDTENFSALATELGLLATCGSDFHGIYRPGVCLGTGRAGNLHAPPGLATSLMRALAGDMAPKSS